MALNLRKKTRFLFLILMSFGIFTFNVCAYTEAPIDILNLTVEEIQNYVDKKVINYEMLTQLYLDRIEVYENTYNAIISINENALEEARKLDSEIQKSGKRSLLHGIPVVIKDNIDYVGLATTGGSKALKDSLPKSNSKVVQNLIDAGAIIIAKTNMSEFAFSAGSSVSSYGRVKNAYNTDLSSYGSSGGSAVAVALQFATLGIGTDTNSSVRIPASAASLYGMRPSLGLVSIEGILPYDATRDTAGPITKSIVDNSILLSAMSGQDEEFYSNLKTSDLKGLKIGVLTEALNGGTCNYKVCNNTYEPIKKLFNEKIDLLENLGVEIVYIDKFYNDKIYNYYSSTLNGWTFCHYFNSYIKNTSSQIKSFQELSSAGGKITDLSGYVGACQRDIKIVDEREKIRQKYRDYIDNFMKEKNLDILIYPSTKNKITTSGVNSTAFWLSPATGYPALTIPIGFDNDNLPYSMEAFTTKNNEQLLYNLAYNMEQVKKEYVLPEKAGALYQVTDNVEDLVNLYMNSEISSIKYTLSSYGEYKTVLKKIKTFFDSYNELENKDADASKLKNEYNEAYQNLETHQEALIRIIKPIVGWGLGVFCIFIALKITIKKKLKQKKNRRK